MEMDMGIYNMIQMGAWTAVRRWADRSIYVHGREDEDKIQMSDMRTMNRKKKGRNNDNHHLRVGIRLEQHLLVLFVQFGGAEDTGDKA